MDILYFSRRYKSNPGGGEQCDKYLTTLLSKKHKINLIYENSDIPIIQRKERTVIARIYEELSELFFIVKNLLIISKAKLIIYTGRSVSASILAFIRPQTVVYNVHGFTNKYSKFILNFFGAKLIYWGNSYVINGSLPSRSYLPNVIPNSDLVLSYNQINKKTFKKNNLLNILWVGRLEPIKDPLFLLDVLKQLNKRNKNWNCNIVGSGSLLDKMIRKHSRLNSQMRKKIKLHGFVDNLDLNKLYQKSNILLITSISENFPIVALEALMNNVRVVTTPIFTNENLLSKFIFSSRDRDSREIAELVINSINSKTKNFPFKFFLKKISSQDKRIIKWLN
jgi:glycosyltransferase involved in cell wall biosynthesis